jgi:1,4-alpha-glucan branching enzyme
MLPLSHDEVVHGKGSLLDKMPGDEWQKMANLRLLLSFQFTHPGKNLLFMGGEIGQFSEWNHDTSIDWHLIDHPLHDGLRRMVKDLNEMYKDEPALHEIDFSPEGFQWIDCTDWEKSIISFIRKSSDPAQKLVIVANFTPRVYEDYRVGLPDFGFWKEIFNSDADYYCGSNTGNYGGVQTHPASMHGFGQSASLTLPPLGMIILKHRSDFNL